MDEKNYIVATAFHRIDLHPFNSLGTLRANVITDHATVLEKFRYAMLLFQI